jgi:hypothetical protein
MPYWLKLFLFILVADVVVLTFAHLLSEYGGGECNVRCVGWLSVNPDRPAGVKKGNLVSGGAVGESSTILWQDKSLRSSSF